MKLHEEFKLFETMWDEKSAPASGAPADKIYVVFNYYPVKYSSGYDLDDFHLHTVSTDRNEVINSLKEEALYRLQGLDSLKNTLVCYYIDPADYDCTVDEFLDAAGEGGQDLHWEFRDIVYALSSMAEYETPLYKLSMDDIQSLYEEYIDKNKEALGFDTDDFYRYFGATDPDAREILDEDPNFKKFITDKLSADITAAI